MRIVVQRVHHASCEVDGKVLQTIKQGYLLFVGFTDTDTLEEVKYLAKKVAHLRIFEDQDGKLNKSILEVGGEILSISQFTLYGDARKGNRPSFTKAMEPKKANQLYETFNQILKETHHIMTKPGQFQAHMNIALTNDGPVTILLEREQND